MSCSRTHKLATLLGQNLCNGFAVFSSKGFSCQNHRTRVNIIGMQACGLVSAVDDGAQGFGIHGGVTQVGREGDG